MKDKNTPVPSENLAAFMSNNSIASIDELNKISDAVLVSMPGFGWRLLKEILLFRKIH